MKRVYADYAATAPVGERVMLEVNRILSDAWGNPSSEHEAGELAKKELESARRRIAELLFCAPECLYFTSGGSESSSLGILGALSCMPDRKKLVVSSIEHHSVLNICGYLSSLGYEIVYLPCTPDGVVADDVIRAAVDENTAMLVLMHSNNETGMIQNIEYAAKIAHGNGALLFSDCVQSVGHVPLNVSTLGADIISFSGHKFGAPKGIGGLYVASGVDFSPIVFGGGQEKGKRGGTENVAYAVAMAKALELSLAENTASLLEKRDTLARGLLKIGGSCLNGSMTGRLPGNVSVSFEGIVGQTAVMLLSLEGIYVSAASACSSNSQEPSHVLTAMGYSEEKALSALRFTISCATSYDDIDYIIEKTEKVISVLRSANK